jgi:hypothetical protein
MFVYIRGGLGNQMFQFAYALILSQKFSLNLKLLDFTKHAKTRRDWGLGCFRLEPENLTLFSKIFLYLLPYVKLLFIKLHIPLMRTFLFEGVNIVNETYCPKYVYGYWQKATFYKSNRRLIKDFFVFPSTRFNREDYGDSPLVAIHVRRGDYVNEKNYRNLHLVCDARWYRSAWLKMKSELSKDARAIVFSDDPLWAKRELRLVGKVEYNAYNKNTPAWVDMANMSKCDHFIISNSSYSWWAAWLGEALNKKVIAPFFWFNNVATKDLDICPAEWMLL